MTVPAHLLVGPERHGVRILAAQLASTLGASTVDTWADASRYDRVHVHLTDRLLSLDDLRRLAAGVRVTATLHDLPQETDGPAFARRRETYRDLLEVVEGWAVSSEHERALVTRHLTPSTPGLVAQLPVVEAEAVPGAGLEQREGCVAWPSGPTAAVFGYVYPGKGHRELIEAAAALRDQVRITVVALGGPAPGHDDLVAELTAQAREAQVGFHVTGHLDDQAVIDRLRRVDVGVCGHRNVSASGSTNHWLAAGRRPLVRRSRYADELAALRPGCYQLYDDSGLPARILAALRAPQTTRLAPDADTRPHLPDTAARYRDWWRAG